METFEIKTSDLKYNDRLIPAFYYYNLTSNVLWDGYSSIKLSECTRLISDGEHSAIPRLKKAKYDKDGQKLSIRYLYGRNIKEGIVNFDPLSDAPYISRTDYNAFKRCHVTENDILLEILGTVGKSAIYKKEYIGIAGIPRHIANIHLESNSPITPEYLTVFFRTKLGKKQINSFVTGNIQKLFSLKNIQDYRVIYPTDKSIVNKITEIEQKALDKEIEALGLITQAQETLHKILSKKVTLHKTKNCFSTSLIQINKTGSLVPQRFLPIYKEAEEQYSKVFGSFPLWKITNGFNGDEIGSKNYVDYVNAKTEKIPFIRTSDIVNHGVDLYPDYFTDDNTFLQKQGLKAKDVLFVKDGKIGETALITNSDKNTILASGIEILRLNEFALKLGLTPEYLFACLSEKTIGQYGARSRTVVSSTLPHIRPKKLYEIQIPILPKSDIEKITKLISRAYDLKEERKQLMKQSIKLLPFD